MEIIKEIKHSKIMKSVFFALVGTILLAISSKIKIPFYPVPMTMQTLVVLLIGIILGWKLGLATITLYLFEGIIGLPVFSGSPEKGIGIVYFTGPTMGYLVGFLFTVYFAGKFHYDTVDLSSLLKNYTVVTNFIKNFLKLTIAISFIYIFGILWLGTLIGWEKPFFTSPLFQVGVQPFLLAELFKVLIVLFSLSKIKKLNQYLK
jgi:biotin transport system substrate-specific component